jgi:phage shock protein A
MAISSRRALFEGAGGLYVLQQELAALQAERKKIDERIGRTQQKIEDAERAFEAAYERVVTGAVGGGNGADTGQAVTPGKLPHRILSRMQGDRARIYTAAELQSELNVPDVQQVRTALARLVEKGLVRRTGVKGQFTI